MLHRPANIPICRPGPANMLCTKLANMFCAKPNKTGMSCAEVPYRFSAGPANMLCAVLENVLCAQSANADTNAAHGLQTYYMRCTGPTNILHLRVHICCTGPAPVFHRAPNMLHKSRKYVLREACRYAAQGLPRYAARSLQI